MQIRSSSWNPCLLINGGVFRFNTQEHYQTFHSYTMYFNFRWNFSEIKKSRLGMFWWHTIHTKFGGN